MNLGSLKNDIDLAERMVKAFDNYMDKLSDIVEVTLPNFLATSEQYVPKLERLKDDSTSEIEALGGLD